MKTHIINNRRPLTKPTWTISVHDATNTREIFHAASTDRAEIYELAAEARRHDPALKIWLTDPYNKRFAWDELI